MAAPTTTARERQTYINFERRADAPSDQAGIDKSVGFAGRRFDRLNQRDRRAIARAISNVNAEQQRVNASKGAVQSWDDDDQTADPPTAIAERDAQNELLNAFVNLEKLLNRLLVVQGRIRGQRVVSKDLTRRLREEANAPQDALSTNINAFQAAAPAASQPPAQPSAEDEQEADPLPETAVSPPPTPPGVKLNGRPDSWKPSPVGWLALGPIGSGSYAAPCLYVRQDHEGNIMDRVIVRDSEFTGNERERQWRDRGWFWTRDRDGEKIPSEVKMLYDLRSRTDYAVKIRNWRIEHRRKVHRMFLEYCARGDLYKVWAGYSEKSTWVPEPFLWYCAEAMAEVGVLLLQGDLDRNPVSDWVPIIHRDWKTANVLLGDSLPHPYSGYPVPKLADFGFATYNRRDGDHSSDGNDKCLGTPGCSPPEAWRNDCGPYTSQSDVWSFGCTLLSLMWEQDGLDEGQLDDLLHNPTGLEPDLTIDTDLTYYSTALRELVEQCMRFKQDARPTFPQILKTIRREAKLYNEGLRSEPPDGRNRIGRDDELESLHRDGLHLGMNLGQAVFDWQNDDPDGRASVNVRTPPRASEYGDDDDVDMGGAAGTDMGT